MLIIAEIWKIYDNVEADQMLVRSSIARSLDDLKAARSVMSKPTGERSRDDRQVVCSDEVARS